jgi:hypothetical protein
MNPQCEFNSFEQPLFFGSVVTQVSPHCQDFEVVAQKFGRFIWQNIGNEEGEPSDAFRYASNFVQCVSDGVVPHCVIRHESSGDGTWHEFLVLFSMLIDHQVVETCWAFDIQK